MKVPKIKGKSKPGNPPVPIDDYKNTKVDPLSQLDIKDPEGQFWKVDYKYWGYFTEKLKDHEVVEGFVKDGNLNAAEKYVREHIFDKPEEYFTLEKLQKSVQVDRKLTLKEILQKAYDLIPHFKSRAEKLDEECDKFISIYNPEIDQILHIRNIIKAYIVDKKFREIMETKEYGQLATNPIQEDFMALNSEWREQIPLYVQDYVELQEYTK